MEFIASKYLRQTPNSRKVMQKGNSMSIPLPAFEFSMFFMTAMLHNISYLNLILEHSKILKMTPPCFCYECVKRDTGMKNIYLRYQQHMAVPCEK